MWRRRSRRAGIPPCSSTPWRGSRRPHSSTTRCASTRPGHGDGRYAAGFQSTRPSSAASTRRSTRRSPRRWTVVPGCHWRLSIQTTRQLTRQRKPRSSRLTTSTSSKTTRWLDLARRRLPRASFRRQGRHERASGGGDAGILTFFRSRFHWMWGCARGARCVEASVMFFLLRWKSEDLICCRGR